MGDSHLSFGERDILFMVETLLPGRSDKQHLVEIIKDDEGFVESMLGNAKLFDRVMGEDSILLQISPKLFFSIVLQRSRKDLQQASHTIELRAGRRIPVFDTDRVVELLSDRGVCDYLASMLASFTRVQGFTWPVRVRKGIWYKHRFSDLDIDSLIRLCQAIEEPQRFPFYKRIADVCLFITGMFPEHVQDKGYWPPGQSQRRRRERDMEDYEEEGRQFYRLAAEHETAAIMQLSQVLETLAGSFMLAEKPLKFVSEHYLITRKNTLFAL